MVIQSYLELTIQCYFYMIIFTTFLHSPLNISNKRDAFKPNMKKICYFIERTLNS